MSENKLVIFLKIFSKCFFDKRFPESFFKILFKINIILSGCSFSNKSFKNSNRESKSSEQDMRYRNISPAIFNFASSTFCRIYWEALTCRVRSILATSGTENSRVPRRHDFPKLRFSDLNLLMTSQILP